MAVEHLPPRSAHQFIGLLRSCHFIALSSNPVGVEATSGAINTIAHQQSELLVPFCPLTFNSSLWKPKNEMSKKQSGFEHSMASILNTLFPPTRPARQRSKPPLQSRANSRDHPHVLGNSRREASLMCLPDVHPVPGNILPDLIGPYACSPGRFPAHVKL